MQDAADNYCNAHSYVDMSALHLSVAALTLPTYKKTPLAWDFQKYGEVEPTVTRAHGQKLVQLQKGKNKPANYAGKVAQTRQQIILNVHHTQTSVVICAPLLVNTFVSGFSR